MIFSAFWITCSTLSLALILIISHAHAGILLSKQKPLLELLPALARMFESTTADEWQIQFRCQNAWM